MAIVQAGRPVITLSRLAGRSCTQAADQQESGRLSPILACNSVLKNRCWQAEEKCPDARPANPQE